jgi:hypothetical protein
LWFVGGPTNKLLVVVIFLGGCGCDGDDGDVDSGTSGSNDSNNKHTTNFPILVNTTQIDSQKGK